MNLDSIKQLVQDSLDGNENPLKAYGIICNQIEELKICAEQVKEAAILEALNQDSKTFTNSGFKFGLKEGGARYDYKHIPEWVKAKKALDAVQAKAKAAYSVYKAGGDVSINAEGDVIELPHVTYNKESLSAKIIKE